jgi:hypothetical protein
MKKLAPPRSGDTKPIYWLSKSFDELYREDYCSVERMCEVFEYALLVDEEPLRKQAAAGATCGPVMHRSI